MNKTQILNEIEKISKELLARKNKQEYYWSVNNKSVAQKNAMGRESYKIAALNEKKSALLYLLTFIMMSRRNDNAKTKFAKNTPFTPRSSIIL